MDFANNNLQITQTNYHTSPGNTYPIRIGLLYVTQDICSGRVLEENLTHPVKLKYTYSI